MIKRKTIKTLTNNLGIRSDMLFWVCEGLSLEEIPRSKIAGTKCYYCLCDFVSYC